MKNDDKLRDSLFEEIKDLGEKISRLDTFVNTNGDDIADGDLRLLQIQLNVMNSYRSVLGARMLRLDY